MYSGMLPKFYQFYYIVIPTISLIGNSAIVYVTIRSRSLRSPCNILIGLISWGDVLHMLSHYVAVGSYNWAENHLMRQDFCVYWQMVPTIGALFSSTLLLSVAIDRMISTRLHYDSLIKSHYVLYISLHITIGLVYAFSMETWIFVNRTSELYEVCIITTPISGTVHTVLSDVKVAYNILILLCHVVLLFWLRKSRLSQDDSKQIHRSVAVISCMTVFGWFGAVMFTVLGVAFNLQIEKLHADLIAGLLVNFGTAANFFVYYFISGMYRRAFDDYLFIGFLKKVVTLKHFPTNHGWAEARRRF
uniref:G_PROTEIN_RECEP_F1_2 domain-containing protein n=1 Tax=Haemonchus contortus TaxID=6289 RepID=A0A7I4Z5A3_HAECO